MQNKKYNGEKGERPQNKERQYEKDSCISAGGYALFGIDRLQRKRAKQDRKFD